MPGWRWKIMDPATMVIVSSVAKHLVSRNWKVILDRLSERLSTRSDLIATDPDGHTYVIEIEVGKGRTHFSEVAKVESLANDFRLEETTTTSPSVTPILVTTREVPKSIRGVAEEVGVVVVEARSDAEAVETLLQRLVQP
jgi:hypothetical protein